MVGRSLRNDVLDRLIEVGKTGDFDRLGLLFTEAEQLRHPSLAPDHETWLATVESLVMEDLIALIKSLTIGERQFKGWRAGSVSPVIRLFGKLSSLDSPRAEEIAGWVLSHTDNPYLPYGTIITARSRWKSTGGISLLHVRGPQRAPRRRRSGSWRLKRGRHSRQRTICSTR
jgi:hypothetical protein